MGDLKGIEKILDLIKQDNLGIWEFSCSPHGEIYNPNTGYVNYKYNLSENGWVSFENYIDFSEKEHGIMCSIFDTIINSGNYGIIDKSYLLGLMNQHLRNFRINIMTSIT